MYDRFTEQAVEVVDFAQDAARNSGQHHTGTEHVLLGLLNEPDGIAALALHVVGVDMASVRSEIRVMFPWLTDERFAGEVPFTPRAEAALERARDESRRLAHKYVGTEHLLLGVVGDTEGAALEILHALGVSPAQISVVVQDLLPTGDQIAVIQREFGVQVHGHLEGWFHPAPSNASRRMMTHAATAAHRDGRDLIQVRDLLSALAGYTHKDALAQAGVDSEDFRRTVELLHQADSSGGRSQPRAGDWTTLVPDHQVRERLAAAGTNATARNSQEVDVVDVLSALADDQNVADILVTYGIDAASVRDALAP